MSCMVDAHAGGLQDGHGAHRVQRNARVLVSPKSAGTWSQELYLHKGRAWGMKLEPESSLLLANIPQPWKTNTAISELCNFATGCVALLNRGWWQQVCFGVEVLLSMMQLLQNTSSVFSDFPRLRFATNGFKGLFFQQGSALDPSGIKIH